MLVARFVSRSGGGHMTDRMEVQPSSSIAWFGDDDAGRHDWCPPNGLRISLRRGAQHRKASKIPCCVSRAIFRFVSPERGGRSGLTHTTAPVKTTARARSPSLVRTQVQAVCGLDSARWPWIARPASSRCGYLLTRTHRTGRIEILRFSGHRPGDPQQLAGHWAQCHLAGLALGTQPFVEDLNHRIVLNRR